MKPHKCAYATSIDRASERAEEEGASYRRWRNKLVAHYYEKPLGYDYEANKQGKEGEGNSTNEEYYEFGGAYHSGDFLVKQSDEFWVFYTILDLKLVKSC